MRNSQSPVIAKAEPASGKTVGIIGGGLQGLLRLTILRFPVMP